MPRPCTLLAVSCVVLAVASTVGDRLSAAPAPAQAAHEDAPRIDWFAGNIEQAFAAAKRSGRPVFLYWGAVWCPPCQQLKATVFSRRDFIEKSRLFVPVYLDGDTAGAQKYGEQFRVSGYPTVVMLRPDRSEILRIAGSMDLAQYANVLDLALGDVAPIAVTLAAVDGATHLGDGACRRLAWHAWGLEDRKPDEDSALATRLAAAAQRCPQGLRGERARLIAVAAVIRAKEAAGADGGGSSAAELEPLVRALHEALGEAATARACLDVLLDIDAHALAAIARLPAPLPRDFLGRFVATMKAASADRRIAEADQIWAVGAGLLAQRALSADGKPPAEASAAAHQRVEQAVAEKHDPYVRSGVINSVEFVLDALDDNARARDIVRGEMATAKAPYYYMAELGDLEEKLGNRSEALSWYERAYREAKGPATRFQWGTSYVLALLRLAPEDAARIGAVAAEVLGELDGPEALYRRSRMRLEKLDARLREWGASGRRRETLAALRAKMQALCVRMPAADPGRASCDAFLASAGTAA